MKTRKTVFWVLAALTVVACVGWTALAASSASDTSRDYNSNDPDMQAAYNAGTAIGFTAIVGPAACIFAALFAVFALLAWRNGVGLREERRHQEQLAAMQSRQQ